MLNDDPDRTPPPRRPTMADGHVLTPESTVAMPAWKFVSIIIAIIAGTSTAVMGYWSIQQAIKDLGSRMVSLDSRLAAFDPAKVRDECREIVRQEAKRSVVVECPKHVLRGEAVATCKIVTPKDER